MVSDKFSSQDSRCKRHIRKNQGQKCTVCNTHSENIPHLFWRCNIVQHFWSMFETFSNEKRITSDKYETERRLCKNMYV